MRLAHPKGQFPDIEPVSVTAWKFAITSRLSGRTEGVALVAPKATYAAILWPGAQRLKRESVPHRSAWRESLIELEPLTPGAVLTTGSPVIRILVGDSTNNTDLILLDIHVVNAHPFDIAKALDAVVQGSRHGAQSPGSVGDGDDL